tara:strand:- start:123 stop:1346 length:1224 start_codon:yes stop_codon:yes gene_type:complete
MVSSRDDFVIAVRSAFLKRNNQQRFSLLSLIVFSIIFLIIGNFNFKFVEFNRTIIKEVIYFSSFVVTTPENFVKNSINKVSNHFNYYDDYQDTKKELQKLKNKDLSKKIILFENKQLKKLIEDYFVEDSQVYAKVLSDKDSPFLRSIIINKGSKNGVKMGMVVYDDIYLIGKVVEVNFITSRVLLISDINSKVPVTILPLNVEAIMGGLNKEKGKLQYIKDGKLIDNNNELIVVTSGSGGIFKSGIPIGNINPSDILDDNEILVNFYGDFSQLKYVKISSYLKEDTAIDQSNKKNFEVSNNQVLTINNQIEEIKVLQQQKIINEEIRAKFEIENAELREKFIRIKKELIEKNKRIKENQIKTKEIEFLELNLKYGHKCKKSFFKPSLYNPKTEEYRDCVFRKGLLKN